MKKIFIIIVLILINSLSYGQSIEDLYNNEEYKEIVKFENQADILTANQLYMIGFSFFQLEKHEKAIDFYDKAIQKGLLDGYVHFEKGMALQNTKRVNEAIREFEKAMITEPKNEEYIIELGFAYYSLEKYDSAVAVFEKAVKLQDTIVIPYYMVPHIYHILKDYNKALAGFYEALNNIKKENKFYLLTLINIGKIEYMFTKNYIKAADAYTKALELAPLDYELYPKLMKAYNGAGKYIEANKQFDKYKTAYFKKELPKELAEYSNVAIDEEIWNEKVITVYKFYKEAKNKNDTCNQVYVLNKADNKINRTFVIQKTNSEPDIFTLCENDISGGTQTEYPYSWKNDNITSGDIKKGVKLILEGKMKPKTINNLFKK